MTNTVTNLIPAPRAGDAPAGNLVDLPVDALADAVAAMLTEARQVGYDQALAETGGASMDPRTVQMLLQAGAAIEREHQADMVGGRAEELCDLFDVVLPAADWRLLAAIPGDLAGLVDVLGRVWDAGHRAGAGEAWSVMQVAVMDKVAEVDAEDAATVESYAASDTAGGGR